MKTIKNIILSIALVAMATTSYGQLSSIKDRLFHNQKNEIEYITVECSDENSRIENWMHDLRSWSTNRVSNDTYDTPVVSDSFVIQNAEVIYEEELGLESWMSVPFQSSLTDEAMTLEDWMTTPFEAGDSLEMESWMTAAWI